MGLVIRQASTVTTPFGGGSAWNSSTTTGGSASVSTSAPSNSSAFKGCQWSNFGAAVGSIKEIRMKYDWNWSADGFASVDDSGAADGGGSAGGGDFSGSAGVSITGPGPVSDNDSDGDSGSANQVLPNNTTLSSLSTDAFCESSSNASGDGSSNGSASVQISGLQVEILTSNFPGILTAM